eukprot:6196692-Pleurochrysis_carterae.AAC.2
MIEYTCMPSECPFATAPGAVPAPPVPWRCTIKQASPPTVRQQVQARIAYYQAVNTNRPLR